MVLVVVRRVVLAVQVVVITPVQPNVEAAQVAPLDVNKVALLHVHLIVQEYVKVALAVAQTAQMVVMELAQ